MSYFDSSLDFAPVAEQNNDPIIPEDRFVFELIGLERSQPDQYRKNGGIKWTWLVWTQDGKPFEFQDEQYQFFRTTSVNANGVPLMNVGTYANEWASAMLGRPLGVNETLKVSELRGKKMSAMVVWEKQKTDPTKKTIKLASLRTVAPDATNAAPPRPSAQVSADATGDDIDKALLISKLDKKVKRAVKLKSPNSLAYEDAMNNADGASIEQLQGLLSTVQDELDDLE